MHPTLLTIGSWRIPSYTVLLDLGFILGLVLAYREGQRLHGAGERVFDLSLWAIAAGAIGGRTGYVLVNWSAFAENWPRALRVWEGGLSFHGAFLSGLLVMGLLSALLPRAGHALSFRALLDTVTPSLALGIVFGWAACLMGGCAYGAVGEGWGHVLLPDLYGIEAYRFATQAVGLGFALLLFVGIWLLRGHWPFSGGAFLMYTLLYFTAHFFLAFARGDEALYLGPWRLAQLFDVLLVFAAAGSLLLLWQQASRARGELAAGGVSSGPSAGEARARQGSDADRSAGDPVEGSAE
jgi:phosphatidylglycerol:prolipoprotein diacylglycerol transferase